MALKRSAWEQVKSGFRIAGTFVLAFSFVAALALSVTLLRLGNDIGVRSAYPFLGAFALLALATVLFYTARIWAKWLLGVLAYCGLRLLFGVPFVFVFGKMPTSELQSAFIIIPAFLISTLLTVRFVNRPPKGAERLGLVFFVVCLVFAMVFQSWAPWVMGIALLAVGNAIHFLTETTEAP